MNFLRSDAELAEGRLKRNEKLKQSAPEKRYVYGIRFNTTYLIKIVQTQKWTYRYICFLPQQTWEGQQDRAGNNQKEVCLWHSLHRYSSWSQIDASFLFFSRQRCCACRWTKEEERESQASSIQKEANVALVSLNLFDIVWFEDICQSGQQPKRGTVYQWHSLHRYLFMVRSKIDVLSVLFSAAMLACRRTREEEPEAKGNGSRKEVTAQYRNENIVAFLVFHRKPARDNKIERGTTKKRYVRLWHSLHRNSSEGVGSCRALFPRRFFLVFGRNERFFVMQFMFARTQTGWTTRPLWLEGCTLCEGMKQSEEFSSGRSALRAKLECAMSA